MVFRGALQCRAGFPACRFTGLSSPVFQKLATGKSPEPAGWKALPYTTFVRLGRRAIPCQDWTHANAVLSEVLSSHRLLAAQRGPGPCERCADLNVLSRRRYFRTDPNRNGRWDLHGRRYAWRSDSHFHEEWLVVF